MGVDEYDHLRESAYRAAGLDAYGRPVRYEPDGNDGWWAYPAGGWEPGEPCGHGRTREAALAGLWEKQNV